MLISEKKVLSLTEIYQIWLDAKLPFAIFKLPNKDEIHTILQVDKHLDTVTEETDLIKQTGFIVSAYKRSSKPSILISPDIYFKGEQIDISILPDHLHDLYLSNSAQRKEANYKDDQPFSIKKEEYLQSVRSIIDQINCGHISKAILSRIITKQTDQHFDPIGFFKNLGVHYPNAFTYVFNLPGEGSWMGATPELLLELNNNQLETVSLAGTLKAGEQWSLKEKVEHQIVADFIENCLRQYYKEAVEIGKMETIKLGPLQHLKTTFNVETEESALLDSLQSLINDLHPTPAVVGMPRNKALDLITSIEHHDREYYTGFLGPLNMNIKTQLFVNLRCMQLLKDQIAIYIGGGITADSKPEQEWEETELKAASLLNIMSR